MSKKLQTTDEVKASKLQLVIRGALLHKAGPETKNKFTGEGYGEQLILRDDAEDIVATLMAVIKARRNKSTIVAFDTEFRADEYNKVGDGMAQMMCWTGKSWFSEVDDERDERSLVKVEVPTYVQDSTTVNGKTYTANGRVVSPDKLDQLIASFNGLNRKIGDDHVIRTSENVNKVSPNFSQWNYLYINDDIRRIGENSDGYGSEFVTLLRPEVSFDGFVFGSATDESPLVTIYEWLW